MSRFLAILCTTVYQGMRTLTPLSLAGVRAVVPRSRDGSAGWPAPNILDFAALALTSHRSAAAADVHQALDMLLVGVRYRSRNG
jgi:hypothetical protein